MFAISKQRHLFVTCIVMLLANYTIHIYLYTSEQKNVNSENWKLFKIGFERKPNYLYKYF